MQAKEVFEILTQEQQEIIKDFNARLGTADAHKEHVHALSDLILEIKKQSSAKLRKNAQSIISKIRTDVLTEFATLAKDLELDAEMQKAIDSHDETHANETKLEFHDPENLTEKQEATILKQKEVIKEVVKKLAIIIKGEQAAIQEEINALFSIQQELDKQTPDTGILEKEHVIIDDNENKLALWLRTEKEQCIDRLKSVLKSYTEIEAEMGRAQYSAWRTMFKSLVEEVKKRIYMQKIIKTDALTFAWNRGFFDDKLIKLTQKVKEEKRRGEIPRFALALADVDDFKKINDTKGHSIGDIVLKDVVNIMKQKVREADYVCRYGGEEFAIIIMAEKSIAAARCEIIRKTVEKQTKAKQAQEYPGVTISIGVAEYPTDGAEADSLKLAADAALYNAKNTGKNKVIEATKEITEEFKRGKPNI